MAMLADKRKRANYVLQPRGKALYDDGNRFGTRMLEKMGWSAGKGLGAKEDGQKEFVRIKYKNSTTGIGFEDRNDQWTQHEQKFDGLLKSLGDSDESPKEDAVPSLGTIGKFSGESLEEKSKKSRARVHYKKFTRGKDLSQYSEKDLANIFGRKTLEKESPLAFGIHSRDESSYSAPEGGEAKEFGITTIRTGTSINDYFKHKIESMKSKTTTVGETSGENNTSKSEDEDEVIKKKRKKKKSKELDELEDCNGLCEKVQNSEVVNGDVNEAFAEDVASNGTFEGSAKVKKSKWHENETQETCDPQNLELTKSKKKKKQKVRENDELADRNGLSQNTPPESEVEHKNTDSGKSSTKRKKRKRCKSEMQETCGPEDVDLNEPKRKKKDKKKINCEEKGASIINEGVTENIESETLADPNDAGLPQRTKKKTKKAKELEIVSDSPLTTELYKTVNEEDSCDKNKKSGKKKKTKTDNVGNESCKNVLDESPNIESNEEKKIPQHHLESNSNNLKNEYKINTFVALKFRNADLNGFPGSNIAEINGYNLPTNLKLVVVEKPQDMVNVTKFCNEAIKEAVTKAKKDENKTPQPEEEVKETGNKKGKRKRSKYTYRQLIHKVQNRNAFNVI